MQLQGSGFSHTFCSPLPLRGEKRPLRALLPGQSESLRESLGAWPDVGQATAPGLAATRRPPPLRVGFWPQAPPGPGRSGLREAPPPSPPPAPGANPVPASGGRCWRFASRSGCSWRRVCPACPERILPAAPGALGAPLNTRSLPPCDRPALQVRGGPRWGGAPERTFWGSWGIGSLTQGSDPTARGGSSRAWGPSGGRTRGICQSGGRRAGLGLKFPVTSDGSGVPGEASETRVLANFPSLASPPPPPVSLGY